jgi:hypothetical protein
VAAEGVVDSVNPLDWLKSKRKKQLLSKWVEVFKIALLLQPQSSVADRVFK